MLSAIFIAKTYQFRKYPVKMEAIQRKLPPNPKNKAGFLSQLLFAWTVPIFKGGYSKALDVADLFQPLRTDRSQSLDDRLDK